MKVKGSRHKTSTHDGPNRNQENGLYVHSNPPKVVNLTSSAIRQMLRIGDMDKLEQIVIDGQGSKLVGEHASDLKVRQFIKTVPSLISKLENLHDAVIRGNVEEAQGLLDRRKMAISKDSHGVSLLHKAVLYGHMDLVKYFVQRYPETLEVKDNFDRTPLHYSASSKDPEEVYQILLRGGSDPLALDDKENTAEYYMENPNELHIKHSTKRESHRHRPKRSGKEIEIFSPKQLNSVHVTRANIRILIHQRDIRKLESLVWEGHGDRLLLETAGSSKVRKFLQSVPHLMTSVKDVHAATINGDAKDLESKSENAGVLTARDVNGLTPLHKAAGLGHESIVTYILDKNPATVSTTDYEGRIPLHYAYIKSDNENVIELLTKGGSDEKAVDARGKTPDYYRLYPQEIDSKLLKVVPEAPRFIPHETSASSSKSLERNITRIHRDRSSERDAAEKVKVKRLAPINLKTVTNDTIDKWLKHNDLEKLEQVVLDGKGHLLSGKSSWNDDVRIFLKRVPHYMKQIKQIHRASGRGDIRQVQRLAENLKLCMSKDEVGAIPLHKASLMGQMNVIRFLTELYPEGTKAQDIKKRLPLHFAAMGDAAYAEETYNLLLKLGSDPEAIDLDGNKAETYLGQKPKDTSSLLRPSGSRSPSGASHGERAPEESDSEVAEAVAKNDVEKLEAMVLDGQGDRLIGHRAVDQEAQDFIQTVPVYMAKINVLHDAIAQGNFRDVASHLDRKKLALAKDSIGATPLHKAIMYGHTDIIRYIIANFPGSMDVADNEGRTPLHFAAVNKDEGHTYKMMVNAGGDPNIKDKNGKTPGYYLRHRELDLQEYRKEYELKKTRKLSPVSNTGAEVGESERQDLSVTREGTEDKGPKEALQENDDTVDKETHDEKETENDPALAGSTESPTPAESGDNDGETAEGEGDSLAKDMEATEDEDSKPAGLESDDTNDVHNENQEAQDKPDVTEEEAPGTPEVSKMANVDDHLDETESPPHAEAGAEKTECSTPNCEGDGPENDSQDNDKGDIENDQNENDGKTAEVSPDNPEGTDVGGSVADDGEDDPKITEAVGEENGLKTPLESEPDAEAPLEGSEVPEKSPENEPVETDESPEEKDEKSEPEGKDDAENSAEKPAVQETVVDEGKEVDLTAHPNDNEIVDPGERVKTELVEIVDVEAVRKDSIDDDGSKTAQTPVEDDGSKTAQTPGEDDVTDEDKSGGLPKSPTDVGGKEEQETTEISPESDGKDMDETKTVEVMEAAGDGCCENKDTLDEKVSENDTKEEDENHQIGDQGDKPHDDTITSDGKDFNAVSNDGQAAVQLSKADCLLDVKGAADSNIIRRESNAAYDPEVQQLLEYGFNRLQWATNSVSLLKRCLTREIFDEIKDKCTSNNATLEDVIQSGVENLDSHLGVYAPDPQSYKVFSPLFDKIIELYHGGFTATDLHKPLDFGDTSEFQDLDPCGTYIKSSRIRVARSIKGYNLNPLMSEDDYRTVERLVENALLDLRDDLQGQYHPLTNMADEDKNRLIKQHYLFKENDRFLKAAKALRFWPIGRGIFFNEDKTFLVWVNEEDHLRIISMLKGGDVGKVYNRLIRGIESLEKNLTFERDERLGYITFCPSNLGTSIRASVHIELPEISKDMNNLKRLCTSLNLQIRGTAGEHSHSVNGILDISNKRRLGLSEIDIMREMYEGVRKLIQLEVEMERSK